MMKFDPITPPEFDLNTEGGRLNSSLSTAPLAESVELAAQKLGLHVKVTGRNDGSLSFSANDLRLETLLETQKYGVISVAKAITLISQLQNNKIRCQTPYRDSNSYAAFFSVNADGKPFVFDSGTGTTHWLENNGLLTIVEEGLAALDYADLYNLKTQPPPVRKWVIKEWFPLGSVVVLFSLGGLGKTLFAQQIATHVAGGLTILGQEVMKGPAILILCEDDNDEVRRRQDKINSVILLAETPRGLYIEGRAGKNNTIFTFESQHNPSPTALLNRIKAECVAKKPVLLVIDNIAQVYAGLENDRHQVTVFCNALTGLAQQFDCCILLLGHTAKAEGSQYSGSTAWEAAVRTRLWLNRNDDGTLELRKAKANYSGLDSVTLQWQDGYLHTVSCGSAEANLVDERAKTAIGLALTHFTQAKITTSNSPHGRNYLPKMMLDQHKLFGINPQTAKRALSSMIELGEVIPNSELGWKTPSRHPAIGLKLVEVKNIEVPENDN
jgi:hypothetical protein